MKALMAVSGLILVGYLLLHMYGNLWMFGGAEAYNGYAHHLRTIGEPMVPYGGVLWIVRIVLLAAVIAHIISAVTLWRHSHKATGGGKRYVSRTKKLLGVQQSFASYTMRIGGLIVIAYVMFHILHLTLKVINPGGATEPYDRMVNSFQAQNWWMVVIYTICILLVGLHLRHGVWSALTTLGANVSATARRNLNLIAVAVAAIVAVGFLLPPYAILLGLVK